MARQTREQAVAVHDAVVAAFDIASLRLPRNVYIRAALNPLKGKISFGPGACPYFLSNAAAFLAAYGHGERLHAGALALTAVSPETWYIDYSPIRNAIHVAYHFAHRAGDSAGAAQLEPFLFREGDVYSLFGEAFYPLDHPPGTQYSAPRPSAEMLDGADLLNPFDDVDEYLKPTPAVPTGWTKDWLAISASGDLRTLSMMWVWGGSEKWSRARIDSHLDDLIEQWHQVEGWAPGW